MSYNVLSGAVQQAKMDGIELSGTFLGDGSGLINLPGPDSVVDAAANRLITFTSATGETLRGEANLIFDGTKLQISGASSPKIVLDVSGNISASQNVSASYYYGDGRFLTGITASGGSGDTITITAMSNGGALTRGFNYQTGAVAQGAVGVNLPASPSAGDVVYVKANAGCNESNPITITRQGSHTIDGYTSVVLESPDGALNIVYATTNLWKIF